jgi:type I restriction enzyme S subunit
MQPIPNSIWFAKLKDSPKYLFVKDYMNDILNNYIFSTGFLGLKANNDYLANYYYSLITSNEFEDNKNRLSIGATMQGINNDTFKEILVPNSSIKEMEAFGKEIDEFLKQIYINKTKINKLKDTKQLYLKKFFG